MTVTPVTFRGRAAGELGGSKAAATRVGAGRFRDARIAAARAYPNMEEMRDRARRIRLETLDRLDEHLDGFADAVDAAGGSVFFAADAAEATSHVRRLAAERGVRTVVKSKSMVTEEIGLNEALEADGVTVVETDLGEFIAQLAGEPPSHIIAPVMHKTRAEIGRLFSDRLGVPYTDDAVELNAIARRHLRETFLTADMGVSGVNFGVASSGSVITVTNEGNARLATTAPPIHVAVMGMERIVPTLEDAAVMLEVLARSATGQPLSAYTNVITGPRRAGDPDGPAEVVVVVVDNGRSDVLASSTAEILACIRCGACLNVCPVYGQVGGHAYGSVYPGPFGSVLVPTLEASARRTDLPHASTLCGACLDACPVRIDIPRLLVEERARVAGTSDDPFGWLGPGLAGYTAAASNPVLWRAFLAAGGVFGRAFGRDGWITRLPFHAAGWTDHRDLPAPAKESFHAWWRKTRGVDGA